MRLKYFPMRRVTGVFMSLTLSLFQGSGDSHGHFCVSPKLVEILPFHPMASVSSLSTGHGSRKAGAASAWSPICSRLTPDLKPMGKPPLADASLDRWLQNAYKSPQRGEALRPRGATTPPGARAARRGARVRRTPRWTRRDCHAVLRQGRRPHPLRGGWLRLPTAGHPRWGLELPRQQLADRGDQRDGGVQERLPLHHDGPAQRQW